jgi:hypothetical protein
VCAIALLTLVMYGEDARTIAELSIDDYLYPDADIYNVSGLPPIALPPPTCDLAHGRWVFDNASVPLYREKDCTTLTKQVTCLANGRPDDTWQYWRWQPNNCSLPTYALICFTSFLSWLARSAARIRSSQLDFLVGESC